MVFSVYLCISDYGSVTLTFITTKQRIHPGLGSGGHLVLVTVGQGVDMGVVEQALLALSPREALLAAAQVIVLDELLAGLVVVLLVLQVGIQHAQTDGGNGHEERQTLPDLVATWGIWFIGQ